MVDRVILHTKTRLSQTATGRCALFGRTAKFILYNVDVDQLLHFPLKIKYSSCSLALVGSRSDEPDDTSGDVPGNFLLMRCSLKG